MPINTSYSEYSNGTQTLYIMQDHPTALFCWLDAYRKGNISANCTLVHIDKHLDFNISATNIDESPRLLAYEIDDVRRFVSNSLHCDHSEFIVNGMYSGLIQDGIAIGFDCRGSFAGNYIKTGSTNTDYILLNDPNQKKHRLYCHKSHKLDCISSLTSNTATHPDTASLVRDSQSKILDIDLDFFTRRLSRPKPIVARNSASISKQLSSSGFQELFRRCDIVTIATEPDYCGGKQYSDLIYGQFNADVFKPLGFDCPEKINFS